MPSHCIPVNNGKSDVLVAIAQEGCTVTVQENEGRDGSGSTVSHKVYEFASETEAQTFYQAKIRTLDPSYSFPIAEPVYLEFSDDRSRKFYEVTTVGLTVTIRYGRIGTEGQTSRSTYDTVQQAQAAAQKKINEKLKKGYARSQISQPSLPSREAIPYWLPEDFRVYTNNRGIVSNNAGGMQDVERRILPTVNQYRGEDGGYVAFYSRDPAKAVYSVGDGIYVIGQIRLKGRYKGRIFHPEGYEDQDISAALEFKELCFKTFGVQGWAGGDTGGWFGHQLAPQPAPSPVMLIPSPKTQILSAVLKADEEMIWQTSQLRFAKRSLRESHCAVQIVAISQSSSFSFNFMAGINIAYHFNPRSTQAQIVQNTRVEGQWGLEERLPLPPDLAFGREFDWRVALHETELAVYLNGSVLCYYQHRIQPAQIDSLRLICGSGNLQVLSVKL